MKINFEYVTSFVVFLLSFFAIYGTLQPHSFITGFAADPKQEETTAVLTVNRYINTGIDSVPLNFSFEGIVPGYWYNASDGNPYNGWPAELIIYWETNANTNTTYWGDDYFCQDGSACDEAYVNRFDVGNLTYNTTGYYNWTQAGDQFDHHVWGRGVVDIQSGNETQIGEASDVLIYNSTCPCGERNYTEFVWYRLFVPQGITAADYTANITFKIMDIGGVT